MPATQSVRTLMEQVTCPHCWHRFKPERVVFVARHEGLLGDPVAGPEAYMRFRPSRFTLEGAALDPMGSECREIACPRCHLPLARDLLESERLSISIVGAPASGKSFLLAAMTWELRQIMPRLGWTFTDALPEANAQLNANERILFLASDPSEPVTLEKTQTQGGELHKVVSIDGQRVMLPNPFQFRLSPRTKSTESSSRVLVVYDNAGEHFLPGREESRAPVTEHLAKAHVIVFLLDPSQDPRLRARLKSDDPQLRSGPALDGAGLARQETILAEAAARVRSVAGLGPHGKHTRPLIVALAKSDLWTSLLGQDPPEPFVDKGDGRLALDTGAVRRVSRKCRTLLNTVCPEIVALAEDFAKSVLYIPTSATGCSPLLVKQGDAEFVGFRPEALAPRWATVPAVCAIQAAAPKLVPAVAGAEEATP